MRRQSLNVAPRERAGNTALARHLAQWVQDRGNTEMASHLDEEATVEDDAYRHVPLLLGGLDSDDSAAGR